MANHFCGIRIINPDPSWIRHGSGTPALTETGTSVWSCRRLDPPAIFGAPFRPFHAGHFPIASNKKNGKLRNPYLVGGLNPSEKYDSQLGWWFPIYGKIKNVPNHQPATCVELSELSGVLLALVVGYSSKNHLNMGNVAMFRYQRIYPSKISKRNQPMFNRGAGHVLVVHDKSPGSWIETSLPSLENVQTIENETWENLWRFNFHGNSWKLSKLSYVLILMPCWIQL